MSAARIPKAIRLAFEAGFCAGVERGHESARVRVIVTDRVVRDDLLTRERALREYYAPSRRIRKKAMP